MKDKPPKPILRKTALGYTPASPFDAEELDGYPLGTEFDLTARTKRSNKQLRTYFKALGAVVTATGRWPTRDALHDALKVRCGRVQPVYDMEGNESGFKADSVALDKMPHKEFCEYMDQAMAVLSEAVGYDVLAWLDQ